MIKQLVKPLRKDLGLVNENQLNNGDCRLKNYPPSPPLPRERLPIKKITGDGWKGFVEASERDLEAPVWIPEPPLGFPWSLPWGLSWVAPKSTK